MITLREYIEQRLGESVADYGRGRYSVFINQGEYGHTQATTKTTSLKKAKEMAAMRHSKMPHMDHHVHDSKTNDYVHTIKGTGKPEED